MLKVLEGDPKVMLQAAAFLNAVKSLLRRFERVFQLLPPGGMGEIARTDEAYALAPRPKIQVGDVPVLARCSRIFRMNMQICYVHMYIITPICGFVNIFGKFWKRSAAFFL